MVIDRHRQPTSGVRRWRWLPLGSLLLVTLGVVVLAGSLLLPPATVTETTATPAWHMSPPSAGAIIVPGLALHPGPEVATLAADLRPATAPAALRAVALPVVATTPFGTAAPGAGELTRSR